MSTKPPLRSMMSFEDWKAYLTAVAKTVYPERLFTFEELVERRDSAIKQALTKIPLDYPLPEIKVPIQIERGFDLDVVIVTFWKTRSGWQFKYFDQF